MNMRHSWITALAAAPLLALTLLPAGAAPATAVSAASGKVTCPVASGSGFFNPPLTHHGSPGGLKIHFHGKLLNSCTSAVTSPPGDKVVGGTFTGDGYYTGSNASSCANFDGPDVVGQITVTITWKTTGTPIPPTTIVYQNNPNTNSGLIVLMTLNAPPGAATKAGSFSGGGPVLTLLQTNVPDSCSTSIPTFTILSQTISGQNSEVSV